MSADPTRLRDDPAIDAGLRDALARVGDAAPPMIDVDAGVARLEDAIRSGGGSGGSTGGGAGGMGGAGGWVVGALAALVIGGGAVVWVASQSQRGGEAGGEAGSGAGAGAGAGAGTGAGAGAGAGAESESESESEPEPEPEPEPGTGSEFESEAESESGPEPGTGSESEFESEAESESGPGTGAGSGTGSGTGSGSGSGSARADVSRRRGAATAREPGGSDGSLHEEMALLARARAALADRPAHALALAREGRQRFGDGVFGEERDAIEVMALASLGRDAEARRRGERFLSRHPDGPFSERVRRTIEPR